jgi:molybdopterin converting factor small subunit
MVEHTVSVALFAGLAEQVGLRQLTVFWRGGTAADLRAELQDRYPHVAMLLSRSSVAVGENFCCDDDAIPDGADVALIPPVSGG